MSKSLKKPQKTREQHIEDVLVDLEKGLANFQLTVQKKKTKQYKSTLGFINLPNKNTRNRFRKTNY